MFVMPPYVHHFLMLLRKEEWEETTCGACHSHFLPGANFCSLLSSGVKRLLIIRHVSVVENDTQMDPNSNFNYRYGETKEAVTHGGYYCILN